MLLPAFLLVGCAKQLSSEEAGKKAAEIAQKQTEAGSPKVLKCEQKQTYNGVQHSGVLEMDVENNFYHTNFDTGEMWLYKGDEAEETWYSVQNTPATSETPAVKAYSKLTSAMAITVAKERAVSMAAAPVALFTYTPVISVFEVKDAEGKANEVKYTSTGDGNLKVELKGTISFMGEESKGEFKLEWTDYKTSYVYFKGTSGTQEVEAEYKFSSSVTIAKPDLSGYIEN